jgi:nucleoside phosphorylase
MSDQYDFGLLVPLDEEFEYIREICPVTRTVPASSELYLEMQLPDGQRGICLVLDEMGLSSAALAADRLLQNFTVPLLALIGLAGGIDPDLKLGDVVVASEVDHYLLSAKAVPSEESYDFKFSGKVWQMAHSVLTHVRAFKRMPETAAIHDEWRSSCVTRRPSFLESDATRLIVRKVPQYFVGPLASGDIVGAAHTFTAWLRGRNRKYLGLEMEAGGAALAAHNRNDPIRLLVVRGISDFADERKSALDGIELPDGDTGVWRKYATQNAFGLFISLLQAGVTASLKEEMRPKA